MRTYSNFQFELLLQLSTPCMDANYVNVDPQVQRKKNLTKTKNWITDSIHSSANVFLCLAKRIKLLSSCQSQTLEECFYCIISDTIRPIFEGIEMIIKNNEEQCLNHKICKKYFSLKWREKGCYLFIIDLVVFLCFHIWLNIYVFLVRGAIAENELPEYGKQMSVCSHY